MAYFPTSPLDGASVTVNGILYTYNASKGAWKRAVSSINNLSVAGNITAAGNISAGNVSAGAVYTTSGLFWAGNGVAFSSFPTALDANVGTLFLGNISTQANLGAFQTYANTTFSTVANAATQQTQINNIVTNANANTAAYLTTYTGNIGAGNIVISGTSGNISGVNYIFATNYVYPNGVSILTGISGGAGTYSNTNVEAYFGANIGSLHVNAATQATAINSINANLGAYQLYANANIGSLLVNAATQATSIDTINANIGAYQTYANVYLSAVTTFTVTNAGAGAYVIDSESNPTLYLIRGQKYNFSVSASGHPFWIKTAASTGTGDQYNTGVTNNGDDVGLITFDVPLTAPDVLYYICQYHSGMVGQLRIVNFANIDANIGTLFLGNASTQANIAAFYAYANTKIGSNSDGNLVISATTTSTNTTTGALVVSGGAGIAGNVFADKFYTSSGIFWSGNGAAYASGGGGGGSFTASSTAPVSPALGSFWYKTTTDVLYEYINDGTTDYWIDIQTQTIAANTSGPSMYAGDVFGANITFTGTITGSVGYLIERANVVASSPPATTNLDLITAPIMYFTSNTTQNITANIRGNATVTLNSLLAIGQSSTFVIFIPNATAYYVNTVKIDNVTVTPFWQGGSSVVSGNSNSIDIYTFAVLKTADATFKVFASQVKYQNLGP